MHDGVGVLSCVVEKRVRKKMGASWRVACDVVATRGGGHGGMRVGE